VVATYFRPDLSARYGVKTLAGQHTEVIARLSQGLDATRGDGTWQKINARWLGQ